MSRLTLLLAALIALPVAAQPALFTTNESARFALTEKQAALLSHLEGSEATTASHLVDVRLAALDEPVLLFNAAPSAEAVLEKASAEPRSSAMTSYAFRSGNDDSHALLVVRNSQVTGTLRIDGQLHVVRPLTRGLHVIAHLDESRFVDHPPEWAAVEAAAARRWSDRAPEVAPDAPTTGRTMVPVVQRVLIPYTPNADAQVGDILALVQLAVDETNQGYQNSNVSHRIELAHTYRTSQNESSSFSTTLNRMANPSDGWFDEIPGLRAQYGADLVQMIAGQNGNLCGQAWTILADDASEGFAVASQTCATGYYTFGHELGHLQGARHNPETDGSLSPFSYGHGRYYTPADWRTVMSYNCPGGCTRVLQWSNPDVDYNGVSTGDTSRRDNARVLDETAASIAAFYADPDPAGVATVAATRTGSSTVPSGGSPMPFDLDFSNTSGNSFSGEYWVMATLPNGNPYGPIFGPTALALDDGDSYSISLVGNVPRGAPTGFYTVTAYVGASYPDAADDSDSFTFTKATGLHVPLAGNEKVLTVTHAPGLSTASSFSPSSSQKLSAPTRLLGAYPNPSSGKTTIGFSLSEQGDLELAVYNTLGQRVAVLASGSYEAGQHEAYFDGARLPNGLYLYRLTHGGALQHGRFTLAK